MMWGWRHGMYAGGSGMMILFWAVVIIGGYYLIRNLNRSNVSVHRPLERDERAIEILKERYARGEIDRDTYQEMRRELENG